MHIHYCLMSYSEHAGPDSEAFFGYGQLRPVMAITASVQPVSGRIVYMPGPSSRIRFGSVFPKKALIVLCKTDPALTWMAWSGFGRTRLVRKQASVQESSGPVLAECTEPDRYQFPASRLGSVLLPTALLRRSVQNQPGSDLVLADCVRSVWPNGYIRKQVGVPQESSVRSTSGQCFRSDPAGSDTNRIRHVYFLMIMSDA